MAAKPSTAKATGNAPAAAPVTATPSSIRRAAGPEVLTGAEAIVRSRAAALDVLTLQTLGQVAQRGAEAAEESHELCPLRFGGA